jgi:hypothetical protein
MKSHYPDAGGRTVVAPSLVRTSGPLVGTRYLIRSEVTRVGRGPANDIVIDGPDAAFVSSQHLEIRREGSGYRVHDLNSTNGTYLDGKRVSSAALTSPCTIELGSGGPTFDFKAEELPSPDLNQTLIAPSRSMAMGGDASGGEKSASGQTHDEILSRAVTAARSARRSGMANQTILIMRQALNAALCQSSRKWKRIVAIMATFLLGMAGFSWWKLHDLSASKRAIDEQIRVLESQLQKAGQDPAEADRVIESLQRYDSQGRALERNPLYRWTPAGPGDYFTQGIRSLLTEFGAEVYSVPPEFSQAVKAYLDRYKGPDRPHMEKVLGAARPALNLMQRIFEQNSLPPDLAYMVLVESAFDNQEASSRGAAGFWQFTVATARAYGLHVGEKVDERLDATKSTRAACKYIRELILDFGSGTSVMLALAAYNVGPPKVKAAIRRVSDPIKQRNFWYLYRVRALPEETREYVPKVIAAMLIGRNPERFGF